MVSPINTLQEIWITLYKPNEYTHEKEQQQNFLYILNCIMALMYSCRHEAGQVSSTAREVPLENPASKT